MGANMNRIPLHIAGLALGRQAGTSQERFTLPVLIYRGLDTTSIWRPLLSKVGVAEAARPRSKGHNGPNHQGPDPPRLRYAPALPPLLDELRSSWGETCGVGSQPTATLAQPNPLREQRTA